ncbi:twin-arginine translocation signal domain-containing protein [Saliphagus sp. GCM10025308]
MTYQNDWSGTLRRTFMKAAAATGVAVGAGTAVATQGMPSRPTSNSTETEAVGRGLLPTRSAGRRIRRSSWRPVRRTRSPGRTETVNPTISLSSTRRTNDSSRPIS